MRSRSSLVSLVICFSLIAINASEDSSSANEIQKNVNEILENYLKTLAKESVLDFTVILSREKHYDDGTVKQVDSVAYSSKAENSTVPENFNLSTITQKNIEKFVNDGKDKGVGVSFSQIDVAENSKNRTDFGTKKPDLFPTGAASIALNEDGFEMGLQNQINDVMYMTDHETVIQVLEYFKNEVIKRNITTTVKTKRVAVINSSGMSARMIQESAETLKKAYKIDVKNRAPIIAALFTEKFPKYTWQVVAESNDYWIKKSVMVQLAVEGDSYQVIGTL